jgi:hypothetical protein
MKSSAADAAPVPLKNRFWAGFLSWLVPGLGHVYQGRWVKGAIFFVSTTFLLVTGQILGEGRTIYWPRPPEGVWGAETLLDQIRQAIGCLGLEGLSRLPVGWVSIPCALQWLARDRGPLPVLGIFAFPPESAEISELNARLGFLWEIARLYTMVAGLLNVFVLWDACVGPAALTAKASEEPNSTTQPAESATS